MGLGDFLEGVGSAIKTGYKAVNDAAYHTTKALAGSTDDWINRISPMGDIHPFGGTVEGVNAAGIAAEHPKETATALKAAGQLVVEHPDVAARGAWEFAKSQATPEKLLETAIITAATAGVGTLAAKGAMGAGEVASASRLASFSEGSTFNKVLGTGEATTMKKVLHPVNTLITQPVKDVAARKVLTAGLKEGTEAGAARQGLAMAVQGGGVKPAALGGLSKEAQTAQRVTRQVKGVVNRTSQFKKATAVTEVLHDPKAAATEFATSHESEIKDFAGKHKEEAIDYAYAHPEDVQKLDEAMGTTKKKPGMGDSGLARARENLAGGGGGAEPPQFTSTTGGGGVPEEPQQPAKLSTDQFQQKPVLQQPSNSQASSGYTSGRGFSANQGMPPVTQQNRPADGVWGRGSKSLSPLRTLGSMKSQKRFYEGANREVFRGVTPDHDWRSVEMRDNQLSFKPVYTGKKLGPEGTPSVGAEPDPSNMREPGGGGDFQPQPALRMANEPVKESAMSKAEPFMSIGSQPEGALNPAVPRIIQPAKAPGSERKITAQQNRSQFFKTGSSWDGEGALPPLSQPMAKPAKQREILGV